jgi:iron complex transport system ATP-binding protein
VSSPLLELRGAAVRRGAFELGPVSATVPAGRTLAVVGPNGSGKTTLLRLAAGDLAPDAGEVLLQGGSASALPRDEAARRVAFLRQGAAPSFATSALELVLHGCWVHQRGWRLASDVDLAAAREALARVGCAALEGRDVRTLSGGELQRVMLAKALAQRAPLVLLDEPTASLDVAQRAGVARLLGLGRDAGLGQIVVTHDLDLAASACDEVLLLARGQAVAAGPPVEVLTSERLSTAFGEALEVERGRGGRLQIGLPVSDPHFGRPRES